MRNVLRTPVVEGFIGLSEWICRLSVYAGLWHNYVIMTFETCALRRRFCPPPHSAPPFEEHISPEFGRWGSACRGIKLTLN